MIPSISVHYLLSGPKATQALEVKDHVAPQALQALAPLPPHRQPDMTQQKAQAQESRSAAMPMDAPLMEQATATRQAHGVQLPRAGVSLVGELCAEQ